ncbi:hypothetical protein [Emcibacter sp.]|uniref:hypothetical protein n=1 Tax=Emcibacter sp. TaxID=1979954 RepID=UPI002AA96044|nr:hypothetical protein [Emcibacter sp.]
MLSVRTATTPEMIDTCHRIRHRAYAEANAWESCDMAEMEMDGHDRRSAHTLVFWHDKPLATGRLCLGPQLPLQSHLPDYPLPVGSMEVGRLCFPSPKIEAVFPREDVIGLLARGLEILRDNHGASDVFVLMRPALQRVLTRVGYRFVKLGPVVDLKGRRWLMRFEGKASAN